MKAFRKGKSRREFHHSFRSQSAMEYLMTYGWAILIIAVVLAALFELGVFNPMTFAPKASPGSCQVVRPEGAGTTNFMSLEGECQGELPQYAAQFNGQSMISSNTYAPSNLQPNFTIAAMIYLNSYSGYPTIYSEGNPGSTLQFGVNNGNLYASIWNAMHWASATSSLKVPLHTWTFVALTLKNGGVNTGTSILYMNTLNQTYPLQEENNSATHYLGIGFNVGYLGGQPFQGLDGSIANVQIYNTTLSANDIQALYQEGIGGAPIKIQNLVGWWPLNGNANDYSGNDNNGVPTNVIYTSNWYSGYSAP